jgi:hypothetical protein
MLDERILLIVPVLSLIGSGRYVYDVLRGQAKPNLVTWVLWTLAPMIAFAAQINQGVGIQSILTFMVGVGPLLVVIAALIRRDGIWKATRFDYVCGALSIFGLILWLITQQGNVAILFAIFADALAALPTIKKSYADPKSESYLVFLFGSINATLTLLTIQVWTFANYAFPVYILAVCLLLVALIKFEFGLRISTYQKSRL